ncbi:BlaI/MecI/CopY family transcriptional regulator [Streptomyces sp. HUAS ZL42]|uniref:BlaI/MecI/CopY family transcriptional regulator n=1 Tax=Streptomyces sp. HUAS ZL42 TaxID=3231715 RepID=UPI00345E8F4F
MSETTSGPTELTSQYAAQVTSDLERNLKEQQRISGELAALQQQLATLQHDHTVLVSMQQALGVPAAPAEPTAAPESEKTTVPAPRKKAATGTSTKKRAKKAPATRSRTPGRKPAAEKASEPATASKSASPTLGELIRHHLAEQNEPRSTTEVTAALNQAHPERGAKPTVVRTTLESLVAKGKVQRTKQGSSVYYTIPDAPEATTEAKAQGDSAE